MYFFLRLEHSISNFGVVGFFSSFGPQPRYYLLSKVFPDDPAKSSLLQPPTQNSVLFSHSTHCLKLYYVYLLIACLVSGRISSVKAGTLSGLSPSIPTTKPSQSRNVCEMKRYIAGILFIPIKK